MLTDLSCVILVAEYDTLLDSNIWVKLPWSHTIMKLTQLLQNLQLEHKPDQGQPLQKGESCTAFQIK